MNIKQVAPILTVPSIDGIKEFYTRYFGLRVTFDSPGYLGLAADEEGVQTINYMKACDDAESVPDVRSVMWGLEVDDVDAEHARLVEAGLPIVRPLQDNPWGDRSFSVVDPAGASIWVYQEIPPAAEFAQYVVADQKGGDGK